MGSDSADTCRITGRRGSSELPPAYPKTEASEGK